MPQDSARNDSSRLKTATVKRRLCLAETPAATLQQKCDVLQRTVDDLQSSLAKSQESLHKTQETMEANNRWLAHVAHDLRNPTSAIRGLAELAMRSVATDGQRSQLSVIQLTADSMLDLINNLLDLSRLQAGPLELNETSVDVEQLLLETLQMSACQAAQKGLEIHHYRARNVPRRFKCDPLRLKQVIGNLVTNAVKFTEHGHVSIHVHRRHAGLEDQLHFIVRDTGVGIPAEMHQAVFDRFQQVRSAAGQGTGLGLAICAELTKRMGGRVWVESRVGRGSRFHVTLPLRASQDGFAEQDERPLAGHRLLLVGAKTPSRSIYRHVLVLAGAEVVCCEPVSTKEILNLPARRAAPFHSLILDCAADDDPEQLIERMGLSLAGTSCQLILLASTIQNGLREIGRRATTKLTKPIAYDDLVKQLASDGTARHADEADQPRAMRILLAEDGDVNQMLATEVLEMQGHQVDVVSDGRHAVAAVQEVEYDLVLMDVEMPEMDGLAATRAIRKLEQAAARRLPIIAMSAHAETQLNQRARRAGIDAYLSKPLDPEQLATTMAKLTRPTPMDGRMTDPAGTPLHPRNVAPTLR